jgi:hypothetical protein
MDDNDNPTQTEMSPLLEGVVGLHEVFSTLVQGGFTEDQALKLVSLVIHNSGGLGSV